MDIWSLASELKRGNFRPVYLVHGEDQWQIQQALSALKALVPQGLREMNCSMLLGKNLKPKTLEEQLHVPVLGGLRLTIVQDATFLKGSRNLGEEHSKDEQKQWLHVLSQAHEQMIIVLTLSEKADSRRKLYQWIASHGAVVDCMPVKGKNMQNYIHSLLRKINMQFEPGVTELLMQSAGDNLGIVHREIEKLMLYCHGQKRITLANAREIVSSPAELAVFDLMDAVSEGRGPDAQELLRRLLKQGEPALMLFSMIVRQIRLLTTARAWLDQGVGANQLASKIGAHPFVAQKAGLQAGYFDLEDLVDILQTAACNDAAMKVGKLDQAMALELLISGLAKKRQNKKHR